jgi:hypothetical protein
LQPSASELRQQLPSYRLVLTTAIILSAIGWIGLLLLFILTVPTLGPRWLLFFLVTLAFSGLALPIAHYLHKRFPGKPVATAAVLVREALWFGAYADILLWLQFGKVLNFALAVLILTGFVAIEVLIRVRERSKWTPPAEENE